jgi:glycosyltransferase involved in cell wall biosynthesis
MKFCFFGDVSNAIKGNTPGGGEQQTYMLARALVLDGHEVVIVDPYAKEAITTAEGIKLIRVPQWDRGIKGLRMFTHRIPALYKIFVAQKADYYYAMMRSYMHLVPYFAAKKAGGKFVLAIASDVDVLDAKTKFKYEYKGNFKLSRFLTQNVPSDFAFDYLLQKADKVTLQHRGQRYKCTAPKNNQVLFSNLIELDKLPKASRSEEDYFVCAGSLTMLKGADNLLKIVDKLDPAIKIRIVGAPKDVMSVAIFEQLKTRKNVQLMGWQPQEKTIEFISKAKALFNTSYFEGFPNIFLEAWGSGVPVISLNVNPGNIFSSFNLGTWCNGDLQKMKDAIEKFDEKSIDRQSMYNYVSTHHDFKTSAARFIQAVES